MSTETLKHPKLQGVQEKIKLLEGMLLADDPKMPGHLRAIHGELLQYEELAHLLTDEEMAVVIEGQQKHLSINLAAETTKSNSSKGGKGLKNVQADDL